MTTVYVVTEGAYSDYSIEAIYSTEEMARAHIALNPYASIEEWRLDAAATELRAGWEAYEVTIRPNGTAKAARLRGVVTEPEVYQNYYGEAVYHLMARDEMAAKQIAMQKWVEGERGTPHARLEQAK